MSGATVRVLWAHELRILLRDRRTVVIAVVLPLLVMPVVLYGTRVMQERRERTLEETSYRFAITGSQAETVRELIARGGEMSRRTGILPASDSGLAKFKTEEVRVADPAAALEAKEIEFYLEMWTGQQADARPPRARDRGTGARADPETPEAKPVLPERARLPGVPLIRIYYKGDSDKSEAGTRRMQDLLAETQHAGRYRMLGERGFTAAPDSTFPVEEENVASTAEVSGSYVGRFLTAFLVLFLVSGGSVVALDIIAGEKERGSLETLLTTAAGRGEIVAAKQLAIVTVAVVTTLIQVANILVYVTLRVIPLPETFVLEAPPTVVVTLLVLFLPVAAFLSAVLLMISAVAKTYKEAQFYFFPVDLLVLLPSLAGVLPGVSLRSAIALVPLANVSVAVREIMVGKFDWPMIALVFAAMAGAAAWMVRQSARLLSNERLVTSSEFDSADLVGGPALFPRHVLRWYGVMGAVLFAVALNVPELATFRRQLLFNELVIFTAFPLLMLRKYRLRAGEAFALRPVQPMVWPALLLIVPSAHLVGIGVFRLADLVIPVPRQMLEQFSRDLLPKDIPVWQLYFFIAVLPGICEELAFRGTLLYGLRRRFRPVGLVVTVGIIFGLFHVALFRVIPTGFMGMVLTAIALLTGSIFPCMLAHAGNNALALWLGMRGLGLADLAWWAYASAGVVMLAGFYWLHRAGTPYPGLRSGRLFK